MKSMRNVATLALCSALALGAVGAGSVAFAADEMPAKSDQPVTDTWITTKDGIVALVGVLPTQAAVDKAVTATETVKGVKSVDSSGLKVK